MTTTPRDRLRELLDAVLDDDNRNLDEMADGAAPSPFRFARQLRDLGRRATCRQLARLYLRHLGRDVDLGDPIEWHRHQMQEHP